MASVRAVKRRGRCSPTDPASLPEELFHQVLHAVYRSGDVACQKSKHSNGFGRTNLKAALVSKRWHRASMQTLTAAGVTAEVATEADLLRELARFKALTNISLYEESIDVLSAKFLEAARNNWPGLRSLVLRNVITEFDGPEPAGAYLPSLTSVVIRYPGDMFVCKYGALTRWLSSLENLTNLELLKGDIHRLPADFGLRFPKLRRFRLANIPGLAGLPESMGDLVSLEALVLDRCDIYALPQAISRLSTLRRLKWRRCSIWDVSAIANLKGLYYLELRTITSEGAIPAGLFAGLKLLRVLKLTNSESTNTALPAGLFAGLKQLQVLKLSTARSSDTPSSPALQSLIHCTGLRVLELQGCEGMLEDIGWLAELTALRTLEVNFERVPDLPANIGALKLLQRACFATGHFKTLPRSFCDMTSLQYLSIGSSVLEELPDSMASLTQLTHLSLSTSDKFNAASNSLRSIPSLQTLSISGCSLTGIPEDLGLLPNLTSLRVQCKPFDSLFPHRFPSLQKLHVFGSLWPDVPGLVAKSEAARLTADDYPRLKSLSITFWNAELLPDALGHLQHLEELHLSHGEFTGLPETLSSLRSLKELHLDECKKLISLPASLGTISSLTTLCLDKCDKFDLDSLTGRLKEVYVS